MLTQAPRPKRYDDPRYGHSNILQDVRDLLKAKYSYKYRRPTEISRELGCTRAEAHLALFYWQHYKVLNSRSSDGRWFYDYQEPWRNA